jgi:hypothetical protein
VTVKPQTALALDIAVALLKLTADAIEQAVRKKLGYVKKALGA